MDPTCSIFPKRASMVAKKELQWVPLFGQFLTASGSVFLDRSNNAMAVKSLAAAGRSIKTRGTSLWLFPEGTRSLSRENQLLPFKKGAFHLAVEAGVPIVPVVCENYSWLYGPGKLESGTLRIRGERTVIHAFFHILSSRIVLDPIMTTNLTAADVPELAIRAHDLMENALREISTHVEPTKVSIPDTSISSPHSPESGDNDDKTDIKHPGDGSSGQSMLSNANLRRNSEAGSTAETESDEGMVLVGRPT